MALISSQPDLRISASPLAPTVSVVLPTFNRAHMLEKAIDSVLAQSYAQYELIVVDDGSTDGTTELLQRYLVDHPNIRLMRHSNRRAPFSRNVGIQAAVGAYVTIFDSDDYYRPRHLETLVKFMERRSELDLVHCHVEVQGNPWVIDYYRPPMTINLSECVISGGFFGKRSAFLQLGGFRNLPYGEDVDLWERAQRSLHVAKLGPPATYVKVQTEDSVTSRVLANPDLVGKAW